MVRQQPRQKAETLFDPRPFQIVQRKGTTVTAENESKSITRDVSFFRRLPPDTPLDHPTGVDWDQGHEQEKEAAGEPVTVVVAEESVQELAGGSVDCEDASGGDNVTSPRPEPVLRRSQRVRSAPKRLEDYVRN